MATNIKITALSDITSANMTYNDLVAVVDMNGTPETKKSSVQLLGNLILGGAGGSNFVNAAIATLAGDVTNAAQPNITSTGTLVSSTVTGNVDAGNVNATTAIVAAYFSGDGANLTNLPAGSATKITDGTSNVDIPTTDGNVTVGVGGTADVLIVTTTGANVAGTLNATGIITGIGSGLSAIAGANVTGEVTNAATANAVALANVSGAGNIASINIDGVASNILYGNGVFAPAGAGSNSAAIANGTSNINIATADGSATIGIGGVADIVTVSGTAVTVVGGVAATYVSGDGANLAAIAGANVTGAVPFATTANAVAGANVSGEVTFAATANAVAGANVSGTINLATFAGTANAVAGANVSGTVPLATNAATANAVAGANVSGAVLFAGTANAVAYANVSGTPTLGNISTINIDGAAANVLYGNGAFAAAPAGGSYGDSNVVTLLNAFGSNTITTTGVIAGVGSGLSGLAGANVTGEVTFAATANAVAGANVSGTVPLATTSGTVSTAAQPNITSTGTLTSLTVTGALGVTTGIITGDGGGISNVVAANISGTVNTAVLAQEVINSAQPNIGSVGTLSTLLVSGNITGQSYISATTAIQTTPVVVASLPAAGTAGAGARAFVSDANDTAFNAVVAGAGANNLPVFSDGTDWRIG